MIPAIVQGYTREAGVRELERRIGRIARKLARRRAESRDLDRGAERRRRKTTVHAADLHDLLGIAPYDPALLTLDHKVGVATGLAYTSVGGEVLEIEVSAIARTRQASAHRHARRRDEGVGERGVELRARARRRARHRSRLSSHARSALAHPGGATPKDGPSAGIAIATAIVSALTGIPVRGDVAMTGEITLRGRVLAIGGLKEKAVAAHRNAVRHVLIPHQNLRDLEELPEEVRTRNHLPSGQDDGRRARAGARARRFRGGRSRRRAALMSAPSGEPLVIRSLEFIGGMATVGGLAAGVVACRRSRSPAGRTSESRRCSTG